MLQIKRIISLEVQSKPMYLRTLLYALRQGVALDQPESGGSMQRMGIEASGPDTPREGEEVFFTEGAVPDRLLDLYLSAHDSSSLTSLVLDVYATYVDAGEVSAFEIFPIPLSQWHRTMPCPVPFPPIRLPEEARATAPSTGKSSPRKSPLRVLWVPRDDPQKGARIMGAVLSVLYAARNGLMDDEVCCRNSSCCTSLRTAALPSSPWGVVLGGGL